MKMNNSGIAAAYDRTLNIFTREYISPMGKMLLACGDTGIIGAWFEGQKYYASGLENAVNCPDAPLLSAASDWLDEYFGGGRPDISGLPLSPDGTDFRRRVWQALCDIPYGETVSYGELAKKLGNTSPRAVGTAVGHNPISVIIPCHRVIGADGALTGYAGGIDRKKLLLELERTVTV